MYHVWLNEMGDNFPRPKKDKVKQIQDARIKLILRLIYFDHFIRNLSDAYEASHETSYGQNELFCKRVFGSSSISFPLRCVAICLA